VLSGKPSEEVGLILNFREEDKAGKAVRPFRAEGEVLKNLKLKRRHTLGRKA